MKKGLFLLLLLSPACASAQALQPALQVDEANHKVRMRSLLVTELYDPPEIALRRTGPDNVPEGTPIAPLIGENIALGLIYAQPYGLNLDFEAKRPDGSDCTGRSSIIVFQTAGQPTAHSRPGRLAAGTTRPGECEPRESWALENDGGQNWSGQPTFEPFGGVETCAFVKVRFFDGRQEREGFVPLLCGR